jgi:hypothetical protein
LVTSHQGYNCGAVLQAFALQQALREMGHACAIVDYDRPMYGTHALFRCPRGPADVLHDLRVLLTLRSQVRMRKRFAEFRAKHLFLTPKTYHSFQDLVADHVVFDVTVVGSDIVWHPQFLSRDSGAVYYLDFLASGRRVAYAPSFGVSEIPPACRDRMASYIKRFDALSAREESGCRIIRDLTGRESANVLDPTLLLPAAAYDAVACQPGPHGPYALVYGLQPSEALERLAVTVRQRLKLPVVALVSTIHRTPSDFRFADRIVPGIGPSEFLGWLKGAEFVCTNSFHGVVFAILFHKRFLSVQSAAMSTRTNSLLDRLGLAAHQLSGAWDLTANDPRLDRIDYAPVGERLLLAIGASRDYLRTALS